MAIGCFWVSGQFKGHGHGKALLNDALQDARDQGRVGLVSVAGMKKMHYGPKPTGRFGARTPLSNDVGDRSPQGIGHRRSEAEAHHKKWQSAWPACECRQVRAKLRHLDRLIQVGRL